MALREELEAQGSWLFRWRSYLPLLLSPFLLIALRNSDSLEKVIGHTAIYFYDSLCITVCLAGLVIRCITVGYVADGTSGRNTKGQRAETLNTTGMYSIVRHPLYLGNLMISIGIASFVRVWWFVVMAALIFWLYYERIMFAEEEFLRKRFGTLYLEWTNRTPALLPRFRNWQRPSLSFSFRNVINREYSGFFGLIVSFTFLDFARSMFAKDGFGLKVTWVIPFFVSTFVFLAVRILRKKTKVFHVERKTHSGVPIPGHVVKGNLPKIQYRR
jgi:protein-S-isoprenylcysteine O-methyltransferase Ste14